MEELKDKLLTPFILPSLFWIAENTLSAPEFTKSLLPAIEPLFKQVDPPQSLILLLSRVNLLIEKTSDIETFKIKVMPLLYTGLEISTDVPHVQEQALKAVRLVLAKLEFAAVKTTVLGKVEQLYSTSNVMSVRINALIVIHTMVPMLDKFTLVEKIVPLLKVKRTRDPGLLMSILAVYDALGKHVSEDVAAKSLLPELWGLSMESQLSVDQFKKFMTVIKAMGDDVEG